jgi:hypothetical protein
MTGGPHIVWHGRYLKVGYLKWQLNMRYVENSLNGRIHISRFYVEYLNSGANENQDPRNIERDQH